MSTRQCARITKSLCCINSEVCKFPYSDGLGNVSTFLDDYERQILEEQRLSALDVALSSTPTRWWGAHKRNIADC